MVLRANGNSSSKSFEKGSTGEEESSEQKERESSEISDVLMTPRYVNNGEKEINDIGDTHSCHAGDTVLQATQQLVVLAQCLLIEKSARQDDIQSELLELWLCVDISLESLLFSL